MSNGSEQLIKDFREELNKLKPAVQVVKEITTFTEDIQKKTLEVWEKSVSIIDELKKISEADHEKAKWLLNDLHQQASAALSSIHELSDKSVNDLHASTLTELARNTQHTRESIGIVQQKALQNLDEVGQHIERFMTELQAKLETLIERIEDVLEAKIDQLHEQIKQLIQNLPSLIDRLADLINALERADIPGRLRRIEDALATLNTSIQNLHGRIDFLELNLREEHKKNHATLQAIEKNLKSTKAIMTSTIVINILLTIGIIIISLVKK